MLVFRQFARGLDLLSLLTLLVLAGCGPLRTEATRTAESSQAKQPPRASQAAAPAKPAKPTKPRRPTAEEISHQYLPLHPVPRDEAEKRIVAVLEDLYTNKPEGMGNILPEDGRLLRMLAETLGAQHVVDVGTANGYSAIWLCLALRSTGGRLTTYEIDPDRIALAQENFRRAGVEPLVTLVAGDAHQTLQQLSGPIDLVLIDAEKEGFADYLRQLLPLVRTGGLILGHDSSTHAHLMEDYFRAIAEHPDLETVFVDASRCGMCLSRKMR